MIRRTFFQDSRRRRSALHAFLLCVAGAVSCASQSSKQPEEARAPSVAPAVLDRAALKERVDVLLSGYERIPTVDDWKPLGPAALSVLVEIYEDTSALPTRRARAVASMAQVDNPDAERELRRVAQDAQADPLYRGTALTALAFRLGPAAAKEIAPLLNDENAQLRDSAARALGQVGTPEAKKSLEERLSKELDPQVREALQQSLTKLQP